METDINRNNVFIDGDKATSWFIINTLLTLGADNSWHAAENENRIKGHLYYINDNNLIDFVSSDSCQGEWLRNAWTEIVQEDYKNYLK